MTLDNLIGNTLERDRMIVLDILRKQRNVSDYSGDPAPASAVEQCIASADDLLDEIRAWLHREHPEWLYE